jgi:GntR family phosphonate transport system transcriptional regulator
MTVDDTPLWRRISDQIGTEIRNGMKAGDKLPTEAQFAARFGVNRHTVRRALNDLVESGLINTRRGAGAFVSAKPTEYPLTKRMRFHSALSATGRIPGRRILSSQAGHATASEAEALGLSIGDPVLWVEGLTLSDGVTIGHFRSCFPLERLPGMAEAIASGLGITDSLSACGVADHVRAWTRLSARAADPILAGHLSLRRGDAVLRAEALNTDPTGVPVEYAEGHFAGERVTLTVTPD